MTRARIALMMLAAVALAGCAERWYPKSDAMTQEDLELAHYQCSIQSAQIPARRPAPPVEYPTDLRTAPQVWNAQAVASDNLAAMILSDLFAIRMRDRCMESLGWWRAGSREEAIRKGWVPPKAK